MVAVVQCIAIKRSLIDVLTLRRGDCITFDGVYEFSPLTGGSTDRLAHFVLEDAPIVRLDGSAELTIYPWMNDGQGELAEYQNITALPRPGAEISVVGRALRSGHGRRP